MNKNPTTNPKEIDIKRQWHLVDLSSDTLGRISVKIANILMGKDKPTFSFNRDDGDYVIAINAAKIRTTGKKLTQKIYYHHTAFAGHLNELNLKDMMLKDPALVIIHGVKGMLPKNKLRDQRIRRLKVFVGTEHQYADKLAKK